MNDDLLHQLNRIRGQVDGIANMIRDERDCLDVVTQILAVRNSLSKVGKQFLTEEAVRCSAGAENSRKFDNVLRQLFSLEA